MSFFWCFSTLNKIMIKIFFCKLITISFKLNVLIKYSNNNEVYKTKKKTLKELKYDILLISN